MTVQFFDRFPIIQYANNSVRNIFAKITLNEKSKNAPENFFQIKLKDDVSLRSDLLAEKYYGSSYSDWLHYMSNSVVDPYNDLFLDSESFMNFIISKYGSVQFAEQKIKHYINNWFENPEDKLTISKYESISKNVKKYYTGRINYANEIIEYVRHRKDWKKSTNKIRILTVDSVSSLTVGTLIYQYVSTNLVASAEIIDVNQEDKKITVKNITGSFVTTAGNIVYRFNSTTQYSVSKIATAHTEDNMSEEEARFWSPVTCYEYENEINELKRTVTVLRSSGISDIFVNIQKLLE
jgi:hypothetical protein